MRDNKKKIDEKMSREEYLYHNTEMLLKKYRDVVLLRIYAELPFSQIAQILKINESSAKVIYFRAKKMLMEVLKDELEM